MVRPAASHLILPLLLLLLTGCGDKPAAKPVDIAPPPMPGEVPEEPTPPGPPPEVDTEWWMRTPAVRLMLVGGQKGKLKPCGCSKPQMGGLARAASVLYQLRRLVKREGADTAIGALAAGWSLEGDGSRQEEAKADYLRAVYEELGFDGILLGGTDVRVPAMGVPRGSDGPAAPRPPVNLVLTDACTAAGTQPELRFRVGKVPIRAYAVADPERAEDLVEAGLARAVPVLAGVFDNLQPDAGTLWLATCDLPDPESREALKDRLPQLGPAVIVSVAPYGFGVRKADGVHVRADSAPLVVELDEFGKGVGVLDVDPAPDGQGWILGYRFIELVPKWGESKIGGGPRKQVVALDALYRRMVREGGYLARFPRHPDEGPAYVGSSACAACHAAIYNAWRRTPHAAALETLQQKDYGWDPECVRCHVVGWERSTDGRSWTAWESGFATPDKTPYLGGVGCESCHGPGAAHVDDPWKAEPARTKPDKGWCVRCHDPENSHGFDEGYQRVFLPGVDHREVPQDRKTVVPPDLQQK